MVLLEAVNFTLKLGAEGTAEQFLLDEELTVETLARSLRVEVAHDAFLSSIARRRVEGRLLCCKQLLEGVDGGHVACEWASSATGLNAINVILDSL